VTMSPRTEGYIQERNGQRGLQTECHVLRRQVCCWFEEGDRGRATQNRIADGLGICIGGDLYRMLGIVLEGLLDEAFLERVETRVPDVKNDRWVLWQRPRGSKRPQDGDRSQVLSNEIVTAALLDEVSAERVARLLEESPGPYVVPGELLADGPLFLNLSDGDDPREHVSTDPGVRLEPATLKANPELAQQAAEATRAVLAQKDQKTEFEAWVRAQFKRLDQCIDTLFEKVHEVKLDGERLTGSVEQKIDLLEDRIDNAIRQARRGNR
jgi:hypothetical protein